MNSNSSCINGSNNCVCIIWCVVGLFLAAAYCELVYGIITGDGGTTSGGSENGSYGFF